MPKITRLRAGLTVAAVAGLALLGTATSALACTSGDGRANPVPGTKVTDCSGIKGVSGSKLDRGDLTFTGGDREKSLTITGVGEGVTVEAIVVVGGNDGHAVYVPGKKGLGEAAPWKDLVAPYNFDHSQPKVDTWFACGTKPTEPPASSEQPTTPAQPTSEAPGATPSKPTAAAPTSSSTPAAVPAGSESGTGGGLANTGFDNAWLIWVAGLLIVVGGGLLVLLRLRRRGSGN